MRLTYLEVFLKRRGPELLPLAEPLHCCWEIISAITTAAKKRKLSGQFDWYVQNGTDICSAMGEGPKGLAGLILKLLGSSTPFSNISYILYT